MGIEFRLLGSLELVVAGTPASVGAGKQRALLAILLLNANAVVSTDRLIEELWGARPPDTAAKALQVYISQLRKVLEPGRAAKETWRVLITQPPGYKLQLSNAWLDVQEFEGQAAEGRTALASGEGQRARMALRRALELWRGPALTDFAFEAFAQPEIQRLEQLRAAAQEDLLQAELETGRHAEAIPQAERLIAAEPLRERAHAHLMLALYRSGRQAEALEAYQRARETLVEELGIEPGRELKALHEAILRHDPTLERPRAAARVEPAPDSPAPAAPRGAGAFVGRAAELSVLGSGLDQALAGHGGVYLIGGEPGIGKTRLAEEIGRLAQQQGAAVFWGRCWEVGGAPAYWPWLQALRSYTSGAPAEMLSRQLGERGGEIAQLLPELREQFPDLPEVSDPDSEGARFRLFDAAAEFLRRVAEEAPVLVVLDDLHAADTPSLLLLRFVAGELGRSGVMVVGTYRDVEVGPGHPLDEALQDLRRQQAGHVIPLGGLSEEAVSALIQAATDVPPARRIASGIHRGTGGNPLFVSELVQLLISENRLADAANEVTGRLTIPQGIGDVIGRRLEQVSGDCRRMLGVASVLGREFAVGALAEVAQRPADELLDVLDEGLTQRVVSEIPGAPGRLRFSHVLIRDVLYDELGAARRRRLHERAGNAVEVLHAADLGPHLPELAHHFYLAGPTGKPEKALSYAERAARRAINQLAYEEAARLFGLAIAVLDSAALAGEAKRCDLLLEVAEAQLRAGQEDEARDAALKAAEIARRRRDPEALARAALDYGGLMVWMAAREDLRLIPLLEEALECLPQADSELRARLMARLCCAIRDQEDRERALPLSEEAVAMARRLGDQRTLAYTLGAHCIMLTHPSMRSRLGAVARDVVAVAQTAGDLDLAFTGHLYHLCSLLQSGDTQATKRALAAMTRLREDLRAPTYSWGSAEVEATLALFEGRFEEAEALIERAYEAGQYAQRFNSAASYALQRFMLHRERGGLEDSTAELRTAADRWPTYRLFHAALANLLVELGRIDEARTVFEEVAAENFKTVHVDEEYLASMSLLAEVCVALRDTARAAEIYERLRPYGDENAFGMIEIALGAVARPLGLLAAALGRAQEAVRHYERAIERNTAMGSPPWSAHAKLGLARLLAADATVVDVNRALGLVHDARATYEELRMEPWVRKSASLLDEVSVSHTGSSGG